jgi:hypothetical protein
VKKYLQTWFIVFCGAVNARPLMVRPNKTKLEGYMRPLDVPSGRGQSPMPARLKQDVGPRFGGCLPKNSAQGGPPAKLAEQLQLQERTQRVQ